MSVISINDLIHELELDVITKGSCLEACFVSSDINRPGLQFANYFDDFGKGTAARLQIVGNMEIDYITQLDSKTRNEIFEKYFSYPIPCVIMTRDLNPPKEMIEKAVKYDRPILKSSLITTRFIHKAIDYLDSKLAPHTTQHGNLVDVYGIGVMITGESGMGKSETALELIKRGHRLVTDDVVEIKKVAENRLIGEAPQVTQYFMEIRGIGIIDIKAMYGVSAIINNKPIDLVINLEYWDREHYYDRLGMDEEFISILGVNVPKLTIPVRPGRNLAIIVEVAARNFRLKNMGYNAPYELDNRIIAHMQSDDNN
jgi:HPr kinase/phosphorylase